MTDPVAWLREQLDEDERVAQSLGGVSLSAYREGGDDGWAVESDDGGPVGAIVGLETLARHIVRWDPARALAEVESKREILGMAASALTDDPDDQTWSDLVLAMTIPYRDRPGYDPAWTPDG